VCDPGTYTLDYGRTSCDVSEAGTYAINGVRNSCPLGTYAESGSSSCNTCETIAASKCDVTGEYLHGCGDLTTFKDPPDETTCDLFDGVDFVFDGGELQVANADTLEECIANVLAVGGIGLTTVIPNLCVAKFGNQVNFLISRVSSSCIFGTSSPNNQIEINATTGGECVTCRESCDSGQYLAHSCDEESLSDVSECKLCETCEAHSLRVNCGMHSNRSYAGDCVACANNATSCEEGTYLSVACNDTLHMYDQSECLPCEPCQSGQYREGCGGDSPGQCVACSESCANQQYLIEKCDGNGTTDTNTCQACGLNEDFSPMCDVGQYVVGCNTTSKGSCRSCERLCAQDHHYMTATCDGGYFDEALASCTPCDFNQCSPGETLLGCAGHSAGVCVVGCECSVDEFCENGNSANCTVCSHTNVSCGEGFYLSERCDGSLTTDVSVCTACPVCSENEYLVGCEGENAGVCVSCLFDSCPDGQYLQGKCDGRGRNDTSLCVHFEPCTGDFEFRNTMTGNCDCDLCPTGQYAAGCDDGLNNSVCTTCADDCLTGFYRANCSDRSEGVCMECESSNCPLGTYATSCHECTSCGSCAVGEYRNGCSGSSSGTCESCSNITCPDGEWLNSPCDGLGMFDSSSCETCSYCEEGQYVEGCSNTTSKGSCKSCATSCPEHNHYMTEQCSAGSLVDDALASCTPCNASRCGPGETLQGCSGHNEGVCVAGCDCEIDQHCSLGNICTPCLYTNETCGEDTFWVSRCEGTHHADISLCLSCNSVACSTGEYLAGCGGTNQGTCVPCKSCAEGTYASTMCSGRESEDVTVCSECASCSDTEYLTECGGVLSLSFLSSHKTYFVTHTNIMHRRYK